MDMSYQQAAFYFYTGTGNSYRVAAWLAGTVEVTGAVVTLRSIESADAVEEIGQGDSALLGLVMPTHGFTAPWAMLSFALRLPRRSGAHAVVVATRAGARIGSTYTPGFEGTATLLVALILLIKGYRVRGMAGIDMPSNWLAIHPGLGPKSVAGITSRAEARSARFLAAVVSGQRPMGGWLAYLLGLLVLPVSIAYLLIGRFFLAKLFYASERCTGCGLCAEHCPNGAIVMQGSGERRRPYWTFHCESCMRCMGFCPNQAVEVSYVLGVGAYLLAGLLPTAAILARLVAHAPLLAFLRWIPGWVLDSANALLAVGLLYPVLHLLLRIGWVNRVLTRVTPTHYYRRYQAPGTTPEEMA
jgi:Pyruvate/2-oxoacid:ferredoxin oxidoreductase delta subunit